MSNGEFLVRGATLICSNGSHKRKINLPKCHGVYAGMHPLLHEWECLSEPFCSKETCNITPFGVCVPTVGCPPTEIKIYKKTKHNSKDGKAGTVEGYQCMPTFTGTWMNTYPYTRIIDNGDKSNDRQYMYVAREMPKGLATLTTDSYLVCKYGGLITPIDSGQHTEVLDSEFYSMGDYLKLRSLLHRQGYPIDFSR